METIILIGVTALLGYSFSEKEEIRNVLQNDPVRNVGMPVEERPVSTNIYNNNMYREAEDATLNLSINNYNKSKEPSLTGVLPPIYNSYSSVGNESILKNNLLDKSVKERSDINNINRYKDVTNVTKNEPSLTDRPMFKTLLNLDITSQSDFSNFGQGAPINESTSLLTGELIEREHTNQVPFFGSNVKQNIESFTNTARLDQYTGNTSTFIHKNEQGPLFDSYQEDIYGTPQITTSVELDRFIPSVYRQNEKPFEPERINAPIEGTINNPVNAASHDFKTIDQLRVADNPQVSYEARTIAGQFGNVRGVIGDVDKNKVDTHFELGQDRFFTSTGVVIGNKERENYEQIQPTSRQSQNREYFGSGKDKEGLRSEPRYATLSNFDNSNELIVLTEENRRQQLRSEQGTRNIARTIGNNGDYGKNSYKLPEQERNTTSAQHTLNINKSDKGQKMGIQDDIKNTIKETMLYNDNSGNIKGILKKSDNSGIIGVNFKTTNKESTIDNNYLAQANKNDNMGYNVANYEAKTTNKETISNNKFNGHASDKNKNTTVYSTYFNPEKVRNHVMSVDYKGNAGYEVVQSENRNKYENAQVNEIKSILVSNERPNGPQNFNISGGIGVIGDVFTKPNKLLSEEVFTYNNISNTSNNIPTKNEIGESENNSRGRNVYGEVENTRETLKYSELINNQLKDNPFYNLHRT